MLTMRRMRNASSPQLTRIRHEGQNAAQRRATKQIEFIDGNKSKRKHTIIHHKRQLPSPSSCSLCHSHCQCLLPWQQSIPCCCHVLLLLLLLPIVWRWVSTKNIYICLKLAKSTDTCASDCLRKCVYVCECVCVCESQKPIRQSQRKSTKGKFILDSILELLKWRNMCAMWNETRSSRAVAAHATASPSTPSTPATPCHAMH